MQHLNTDQVGNISVRNFNMKKDSSFVATAGLTHAAVLLIDGVHYLVGYNQPAGVILINLYDKTVFKPIPFDNILGKWY